MKNNWKESLEEFCYGENGMLIDNPQERLPEFTKFIENLLAEQKKELMGQERQFIINVLDGIDIADKQMGVMGGTQAIRQALKNRII